MSCQYLVQYHSICLLSHNIWISYLTRLNMTSLQFLPWWKIVKKYPKTQHLGQMTVHRLPTAMEPTPLFARLKWSLWNPTRKMCFNSAFGTHLRGRTKTAFSLLHYCIFHSARPRKGHTDHYLILVPWKHKSVSSRTRSCLRQQLFMVQNQRANGSPPR